MPHAQTLLSLHVLPTHAVATFLTLVYGPPVTLTLNGCAQAIMKGKWPGHGGPKGATPISQVLSRALPATCACRCRLLSHSFSISMSGKTECSIWRGLCMCPKVRNATSLQHSTINAYLSHTLSIELVAGVEQKTREQALDCLSDIAPKLRPVPTF